MKLLVITPVRDEADYIEQTIRCMVRQTERPDRWIIVNDGSSDGTGAIVKKYAGIYPFIQYLELPDRGERLPGRGVVEAFYAGLASVDYTGYDLISKFDGDLEFADDTIGKIKREFELDPRLGITGGVRYEKKTPNSPPTRLVVSKEFVGGPYKFYRRECFEDIGGLIRRAGWDGVDDIKARMKGWDTGEREHIAFMHLRPTGTAHGEGPARANMKYGDISWYMGGYFWYFVLRVITRSLAARSFLPAYYMVKGYFNSMVMGVERESKDFRKFYRTVQFENVFYRLGMLFRKSELPAEIGRQA